MLTEQYLHNFSAGKSRENRGDEDLKTNYRVTQAVRVGFEENFQLKNWLIMKND